MGVGFSDDVSHILLGGRHGRCARARSRGFECVFLRVLTRGRLLVMRKFDGVGVLGRLWMFFSWGEWGFTVPCFKTITNGVVEPRDPKHVR